MNFIFKPPFTKQLFIDCICGSETSPPMKFKLENNSETIWKLYLDLISKKRDGILTERHLYDFVSKSLNLEETQLRKGIEMSLSP